MRRNPNFRGETYPCEGMPGDREAGRLDDCGKPLPFIDEVVAKYVAEGINDREFDEAIKGAVGAFVVRLDSPNVIASTISTYTFAGVGVELMDKQAANYQAVTKEAVNAFIRANFDLSKAVTVVVGTV